MREPENICQVAALNIDLMGFIFYPESPRYVVGNRTFFAEPVAALAASPAGAVVPTAELIGEDVSVDTIRYCLKAKAGVFVNEPLPGILHIAERYDLDYLQLHGDESPGHCEALRRQGYSIIKVFPVASMADLNRVADYRNSADYFLFDTKCTHYGGSGMRFDWSVLNEYKESVPFFISGGLTPGCVQDISLLAHHPAFEGIDLNSGFEISPAVKDVEKLKSFIDVIRRCT